MGRIGRIDYKGKERQAIFLNNTLTLTHSYTLTYTHTHARTCLYPRRHRRSITPSYASTSAFVTRPRGPVPTTFSRATAARSASLRARGLANTRSPLAPLACCCCGAGVGDGGEEGVGALDAVVADSDGCAGSGCCAGSGADSSGLAPWSACDGLCACVCVCVRVRACACVCVCACFSTSSVRPFHPSSFSHTHTHTLSLSPDIRRLRVARSFQRRQQTPCRRRGSGQAGQS